VQILCCNFCGLTNYKAITLRTATYEWNVIFAPNYGIWKKRNSLSQLPRLL
jgi:hypothetical protein